MASKVLLPFLAAVLFFHGSSAGAQSVSELLQKGIYTEETVGDLPAAMKIYQKIVADDKATRPLVAQAQYRLGMCQLKQGKKDEATKTFEDLVKRFPEQTELVTEARKHLDSGLELLPVPWQDGEVLQSAVYLGAKEYGPFFLSADLAEIGGKKIWRLALLTYYGGGTNRTVWRVEADYQTFRPIHILFDSSIIGRLQADYARNEVTITSKIRGKESSQKLEANGVVYDDMQMMYLVRRLPLAEGYRATVPQFTILGGGLSRLTLEVTAKEKIRVPAGEFECYKLELGTGIRMWYSSDVKHYPVKLEAGGLTTELAVIQPPSEYSNPSLGITLSLPSGWHFYKEPSTQGMALLLSLPDPNAAAISQLWVKKLDQFKPEEKTSARSLAETMLSKYKADLTSYKVRPESWKDMKLADRPAVACVADYLDGDRKMVAWSTCVLGKSTASLFIVMIQPEKLEAFQKAFAPILEKYQAN